jgi:VWFA-related protein
VLQSADTARSDEPNTVTFDLIALGKDGQPITDLKLDELRLLEDKQELKIKSASPALSDPLTICLFFDASASRRPDRFIPEEARLASELVHSIWREGDTGLVVLFGEGAYLPSQPTKNVEKIDEGLKLVPQASYGGSTALFDVLTVADPVKFASAPGRKIYVVFSDFEDNRSRHTPQQVVEAAHKAGVSIFPILLREGFGNLYNKRSAKISKEQAQMLADKTGGEVLIPESGKQLAATMQILASHLRSAYRIAYIPSAGVSEKSHKWPHIHLETSRPHVKLLYPKA